MQDNPGETGAYYFDFCKEIGYFLISQDFYTADYCVFTKSML